MENSNYMKMTRINSFNKINKKLIVNKITIQPLLWTLAFIISSGLLYGQKETISFNVSMENPNNHYYHVTMDYTGATTSSLNFKLPSWTPGYYLILDYAKNIISFNAAGDNGKPLKWHKTAKNVWQVETGGSGEIRINYDVYAFRVSVGEPFLDDGRAFIAPAGVFMYVEGKLNLPCTLTVNPYYNFKTISTGLDPVEGKTDTFYAPDFDILYDSPFLIGNQELLTFNVDGIKHTMAIESPGPFDREKIISDHKKMVEAAVSFIGEIPYRHYTFLIMNRGMGGLEHLNSMAVFTNTGTFGQERGYERWLSFVAHEFFHLYNVKRIRPVELGPFDYDKENYTTMLWVSEGFTVYYEYLVLNRAGLMSRENVFKELSSVIRSYENVPGHLFQSAAESSFDTWIQFFNRSENASNTTISYYDKGCTLGLLLDLKIRYESKNQKSLEDVMRYLYHVYYKEKKRGFTEKEFREACELAAGRPLDEIFEVYVPTTREVNYQKYLDYSGLKIDTEPFEATGAWLGISTRTEGNNLVIARSEWNSPAYKAGLSAQDIINEINGEKASPELLNKITDNGTPGDKVSVTVTHRGITNTVGVVLEKKIIKTFEIRLKPDITPDQKAILEKWLK
jgi:predicted metalloprotease with PDZ domain